MTLIDTASLRVMVDWVGWTLVHAMWQVAIIGGWTVLAFRLLGRAQPALRCAVGQAASIAMCVVPIVSASVGLRWELAVVSGLASATARITSLLPAIVAAWTCGVLILSLRAAQNWRAVLTLRGRGLHALDRRWPAVVEQMAQRLDLSKGVSVFGSELANVPCTIGWLRPLVLMPLDALAGLPAGHLGAIIAHELAHVKRHDYAWNVLQTAAEVILFFHPVMWWLARRIRRERELACDLLAVRACGDRLVYAHALAGVEQLRAHGSSVMAASGGDLLERVRVLTESTTRTIAPVSVMAGSAIILSGAVLAVTAVLVAGVTMPATELTGAPASPTLVLMAMLGLAIGMRHALEPDHVMTVATLVAEERRPLDTARLGVAWGLGHAATLTIVAAALTGMQREMPGRVAVLLECGVAATLLLLGVRAVRLGLRAGSTGSERLHAHRSLVHRHAAPPGHVHVGRWTIARRPLLVGMLHGLAGSGSLTALAMATLPTTAERMGFILVFAAGSIVGMATISGFAGWPIVRLARQPRISAFVNVATGALSIVFALAWLTTLR